MTNPFFDRPVLNSPYAYPARHWELDDQGEPTQQILESRRRAEFITPIPKPRKRTGSDAQQQIVFDEGQGLSTSAQQYERTAVMINAVRQQVDQWRHLLHPNQWHVTPETARLLQHWRQHQFSTIRPFFCQVEAVETAMWLTEVAPNAGRVRTRMPRKGRGKSKTRDPLSLPVELQTALEALYRHYKQTYALWAAAGISVPPCFIVVCNNTSTSKLVYDYIAGFQRDNEDGSSTLEHGRLELFRNFDEHGNPLGRPRTLLIDSEQLESGDALDSNFRAMAADEIDRFRREIIERTGDRQQAENITDQDLLREVMNTVGKPGRLGDSIRCVVSVAMLTEGWDADTVTHVLGVRAFGTQLLCEQVIGRALRRQSYDLNEQGRFNVEYADVLGVPFDCTARPVVAPPQPPRETIQVKAVRPERDPLAIRFPRVQGYRVELPEERLTAAFNEDSVLELTPDLVGPSITRNQGIIGEGIDLNLIHTGDLRHSTLLFHITQRLLYTKWRDPGEEPKLHLFGQLKRLTKQWLDTCLVCKGGTYPAQLMYQELTDMSCERITAGITRALVGERPIKTLLDPYNPTGSTMHVNFTTSKTSRWQTDARRCHLNWVILDSDWEAEFCRVAESHPQVQAYVKNHNLGLEVPYRYGSETRRYIPDFIVLVDDGDGEADPLHLIVEIKGYCREDAKEKKATMETYWVPGVNNHGQYGRWAFAEFTDVYQMQTDFEAKVETEFNKMIESMVHGA